LEYLVKELNGIYAVWLAEVNRYILFREPAFRVFMLWAECKPEQEIIEDTSIKYKLPLNEAERFTNEIIKQVYGLLHEKNIKEETSITHIFPQNHYQQNLRRTYDINGTKILIIYGNSYIEEHIHPKLQHLAAIPFNNEIAQSYLLSYTDGSYSLEKENESCIKTDYARLEELAGGVYLELLNIIHGISPVSWMGVAHASAISDGNNAVLFMAPSGGGKSTIAAIMLANGYKLISDDFVPISLIEPEIYNFPAGISVKESSIAHLKEYFPELSDSRITERAGLNKTGVYLPFPCIGADEKNVKAKAVVFVQYDKSVVCKIERQLNHEFMEQFLVESWIANNPAAAGRFMEWYFNLGVYTLHYSNTKKAVAAIKKIFSI
jgi:hypothetical protein